MGLYDRDYYRDEPHGLANWMPGRVTVGIIACLCGLFFLQLLTKGPDKVDALLVAGEFSLDKVRNGEVWRIVTAAFLHDSNSILPVLFSLLILYFFGRGLEDDLGGPELLAYCLAALVVTQLAEFFARLIGLEDPLQTSCGSVGIVAAVAVLYACRHPRETVRLMFVLPVPMWSVAAGMVVLSLTGYFSTKAPALPLAGAAFGYLYFTSQVRLSAYLRGPRRPARVRPQLRVLAVDEEDEPEPVASRPSKPEFSLNEQLEAKVDSVLEKVARLGPASLTAEENQVLLRASEVYRKRRE